MKYVILSFFILTSVACQLEVAADVEADEYESIDFVKLVDLHPSVRETSGMTKLGSDIWTHNDSGNPNEIYQLNLQGQLERKVLLKDAVNTDWEDMTSDGTHLYVGNFGNNLGARKDLNIYGISVGDLDTTQASVDKDINISYRDQTVYPGSYNHNFDCEAMISYGDSIYLFSKSFEDQFCMLYSVPKTSGSYELMPNDTFDTEGVITGAALSPSLDRLCLLGYNFNRGRFAPFIWLFSDYNSPDFFGGHAIRYNLGSKRQMEAVEWVSDSTIYITAESESLGSPSLFRIDL